MRPSWAPADVPTAPALVTGRLLATADGDTTRRPLSLEHTRTVQRTRVRRARSLGGGHRRRRRLIGRRCDQNTGASWTLPTSPTPRRTAAPYHARRGHRSAHGRRPGGHRRTRSCDLLGAPTANTASRCSLRCSPPPAVGGRRGCFSRVTPPSQDQVERQPASTTPRRRPIRPHFIGGYSTLVVVYRGTKTGYTMLVSRNLTGSTTALPPAQAACLFNGYGRTRSMVE